MKILFTIITIIFYSSSQAAIYKCTKNNRISYQEKPCNESGSMGYEFEIQNDLTEDQQAFAKEKMAVELDDYNDAKKLKKQEHDKERLIRAEENKADAAYKSVYQAKRQASALEERNDIERSDYNYSSLYLREYPYYGRNSYGNSYGRYPNSRHPYGRNPNLRSPRKHNHRSSQDH